VPVWGCVFAPKLDWMYGGGTTQKPWKTEDGKPRRRISVVDSSDAVTRPYRFVASKWHRGPDIEKLCKRFPDAELVSMGSSLKFCLVAEGRADAYLRDVPTMEWDTAAADAVLRAAGGVVRTYPELEILDYNKETLKNPFLVATTDAMLPLLFPAD